MIQNLDQLEEAAKRIDCTRSDERSHEYGGMAFVTWRNGEHWYAQVEGCSDFGVGVDRQSVIEMAEYHIDESGGEE